MNQKVLDVAREPRHTFGVFDAIAGIFYGPVFVFVRLHFWFPELGIQTVEESRTLGWKSDKFCYVHHFTSPAAASLPAEAGVWCPVL